MSKVWTQSDQAGVITQIWRAASILGKAALFVLAAVLVGTAVAPQIAPYTLGANQGYRQPACMGRGETLHRSFLGFDNFSVEEQRAAYQDGFRSYRNEHGDCFPLGPNGQEGP